MDWMEDPTGDVFVWHCPSVLLFSRPPDQAVESPRFRGGKMLAGTEWVLSLYPRGDDMPDFVSVFLKRVDDNQGGPATLDARFRLSLLDLDMREHRSATCDHSFLSGSAYGVRRMVPRKELLADPFSLMRGGSIVFRCSIRRFVSTKRHPTHNVLRTRVAVEELNCTWPIENFHRVTEANKAVVFLSTNSERDFLKVSCHYSRTSKQLKIAYSLAKNEKRACFVWLRACVLDRNRKAGVSEETGCTMEQGRELVLPVESEEPFLVDGVLTLQLHFRISDGSQQYFLEAVLTPLREKPADGGGRTLKQDVEKQAECVLFPDIRLRAEGENFFAHKSMLAARSPLFERMLEEMEEDKAERRQRKAKGDTAEEGVQEVKEDTAVEGVQEVREDTAEEGVQKVKEDTAEKRLQEVKEGTVEEGVQKAKEDTAEEGVQKVKEDTAEEGVQKVKEDTAEKRLQEVKEDTAEKRLQEVKKDTAEERLEGVKEDTAEERLQEVKEDTTAEEMETGGDATQHHSGTESSDTNSEVITEMTASSNEEKETEQSEAANSQIPEPNAEESVQEQENVLVIDDVDKDTVRNMLKFLYSDSLPATLDFDAGRRLYWAAVKYDIKLLRKECLLKLRPAVTKDSAVRALILSDETQDPYLRYHALRQIFKHTDEVLASSEWIALQNRNKKLAKLVLDRLSEEKKTDFEYWSGI